MTTLAQRATAAAGQTRAADPSLSNRIPDPLRAGLRRTIARSITAVLGVSPAEVLVTDDPARTYGAWRGFLITVTDDSPSGGTYRFIPEIGVDESFMILGKCDQCAGEVPLAGISDLVDLGRYLDPTDADHATLRPAKFDWDPGHDQHCPRRRPDG